MKHESSLVKWLLASLAISALLGGCGSPTTTTDGPKTGTSSEPAASTGTVTSMGSSFVQPFLSKVFDEYAKKSGFQINYQGGGSGKGISSIFDGTSPFAASDAPMNDEELGKAKGKILNLPIVLGAVAVIYNVPGVTTPIKLDGETLADIFMVKIKKWNDPKITALNPGLTLPDLDIAVQARADGSGTTYVFSDYLASVSPGWKTKMGVNKKLSWEGSVTQSPQSDGVAKSAKSTEGAIAYIEVTWAKKAGLAVAEIKNSAGKFIAPSSAGATAAAAATKLPDDFRGSIVNAPGEESYPISSFVFGLIPEDLSGNADGQKVVDAFKYIVGEGQEFALELEYAKLPDDVAKKVLAALGSIKVK